MVPLDGAKDSRSEVGKGGELSAPTLTGNSLASVPLLSCPARYRLRQLNTRLALTPCTRATRAKLPTPERLQADPPGGSDHQGTRASRFRDADRK